MKIGVRQDAAMSAGALFDAMARRPPVEQFGGRAGISVERLDDLAAPGRGMRWRLRFAYLGRDYESETRLTRFERAEAMEFEGAAGGLTTRWRLDLIPLSPAMTRLALTVEPRAGSLAGRALLQGLKLRRARIEERLGSFLGDYVRRLERGAGPGA
ncbi:MAG: hypothetical protein ACLFTP_09040 [Rhodosalinus sp.]|uniref:hypothetical protein n=1 Tax=Rhodosalinus sp. TaxID=2047741 RepID=UPI003978B546